VLKEEKRLSPLPLRFDQSAIFAVKEIALRPGVHIIVSSGTFPTNLEHTSEAFAPIVELSYSRAGDIQGEVNKDLVELKSGYASLGFINQAFCHAEYKAGFDMKVYSIWVQPEAFNVFCRAVSGKSNVTFSSFQKKDYRVLPFKTNPQEEYLLSKIDRCLEDPADRLNKLFLESQILELLSLNLERFL
jgi:hypothetical protein